MNRHLVAVEPRQWRLAFIIVLLGSWSPPAAAQCFRGRPLETCRSFFVTEFDARFHSTRTSAGSGTSDHLTVGMTAGWMLNVSARSAIGATLSLDPDTEYSNWFWAVGPRYRYWLSPTTSLDGLATVALDGGSMRNVTVQAVMMYHDLIGVEGGIVFDMVDDAYEREPVRPFFGARLGSYPAVVAFAATALLFALYYAAGASDS
jgi:hypothetical protein